MLALVMTVNINASANSWGGNDPATAKGLANSDVDLGSGNDRLWVNASSSGGNSQATAVENSDIDTGSGNDSVSINANAAQWRLVVGWRLC